jgi:hydrogenase expression/formation protein HypE
VLIAVAPGPSAGRALAALRADPLGAEAAVFGRIVPDHVGLVALHTAIGGSRIVDLLPGDQLPRIC